MEPKSPAAFDSKISNPNSLTGRLVNLEPIQTLHIDALEKHYSSDISLYYPARFATMRDYYSEIVQKSAFGRVVIYALILRNSGQPIGCTGFFSIDPANLKLEIGGSWVGARFQGSAANAESKLLLMSYAFDELGCLRVEFKTDLLNTKSQAAMEKLGITKEGVHRNHLLMSDGRRRHSVYYSVIEEEWPEVKKLMTQRVSQKANLAPSN